MKRKLQKSLVLSSLIFMGLTITLPSITLALAETVNETQVTEKQDVNLPSDNLLGSTNSDSYDSKEETIVEEQPIFSFEKEAMTGTVGETKTVVILVDRPTSQVQVTIPQEITIQRKELPKGLEAIQMTETEWWFSSEESTKFTIPVFSETAGEFNVRIEDELDGIITFEEADDDGIKGEEEIADEPDEVEDILIQEVPIEKESPTQGTEEVTPATISNVSTWAQFRTAINTNSVTQINVTSNISGNTSLNTVNRSIVINGNGYTVNMQDQFIRVSGSNRQVTARNIFMQGTGHVFQPGETARNSIFIFSDVHFSGGGLLGIASNGSNFDANISAIFDGGTSTGVRLTSRSSVTVTNGASVYMTGTQFASHLSGLGSLTIDRGSKVQLDGAFLNLRSLNISGELSVSSSLTSAPINMLASNNGVISLESTGNLKLVNFGNAQSLITGPLTSLNIANGAAFDFINHSGPVINLSSASNVSIDTKNLAVWNLGRTNIDGITPSQNFENIETQLSGINAATITSTNHNVFRSTYSKQGLAGYSRISSTGIAGKIPVDPLQPDTEINPENPPVIPENQGNLRLDFVSQFAFGEQERNLFEEQTYYALPQYGLDSNGEIIESEPKPNFVQVTDNRSDADGWQLSVRQQEQFKTEAGNELFGAHLQLMNRQLAADHDGKQPTESSLADTLTLIPGERQTLLFSSSGEGKGTWIYRFGDGTTYDQSIALTVPKDTIPEINAYETKIDWELLAVPMND